MSSADNTKKNTCCSSPGHALASALSLLVLTSPSGAMQALDDHQLSAVAGQDGLSITVSTEQISADQVRWTMDEGSHLEASLLADQFSITSLVDGGASPAQLSTSLDWGSTANGTPAVSLEMALDPVRLEIQDLGLQGKDDATSRQFGSLAMDASAEIKLTNLRGLFNNLEGADFYGRLSDVNVYHRQLDDPAAPYLILADGSAMWRVNNGSLGLTSNDPARPLAVGGIRTQADYIDVQLQQTTRYKNPALLGAPSTMHMSVDDAIGMYHFGWKGTLLDAELIFGSRGLAYGGVLSEGLAFSSRWNYLREDGSSSLAPGVALTNRPSTAEGFRWIFGAGEASAGQQYPVGFELTDWRNMPGKAFGHDFPLLALDVVNPGQGNPQLCWGALSTGSCAGAASQLVGFSPTRTAVALSMRDGNLGTYAETLRLYDGSDPTQPFNPNQANNREMDWSLIYTFGNLDADIYLSPGGHPSNPERGLLADIFVMSQTLDATSMRQGSNWADGTHLMIADTSEAKGLGLMDISFLLLAKDTSILLLPTSAGAGGEHDGGIDITSPRARFNLRGTFGGRDLPLKGTNAFRTDLGFPLTESRVLVGGLNAWNYEGFLNVRLSPPPAGENYLGYSLAMRATSDLVPSADGQTSGRGTYFAMAEPSQPDAELRFGGVSGDMAIVDGKVELIGAHEEGDNTPKLRMSHNILVGLSAQGRMHNAAQALGGPNQLPGGAAGQIFRIDSLQLGDRNLGSIVVPGGQFYGSMTIKPQTPTH